MAVGGGGAVAVAVAGLTKRFFNHIQKDFLINVWAYLKCDANFGGRKSHQSLKVCPRSPSQVEKSGTVSKVPGEKKTFFSSNFFEIFSIFRFWVGGAAPHTP